MRRRALLLGLAAAVVTAVALPPRAQSFQARDHLNAEEADLVKDAQVLDQRIEVFVRAADRRLLVLTGAAVDRTHRLKKDSEKWGERPTGTRADLLGDIAKILDEAIANIDDVSSRDEKNPLIPKALRKLAAAVTRIFDQLRPIEVQVRGDGEIAHFEQLRENGESILEAAKKLPPPIEKKGKSKKEKSSDKNDPRPAARGATGRTLASTDQLSKVAYLAAAPQPTRGLSFELPY